MELLGKRKFACALWHVGAMRWDQVCSDPEKAWRFLWSRCHGRGRLFPVNGKQELEAPSKFCKENDFLAPCHLFSLRHVLYNNK